MPGLDEPGSLRNKKNVKFDTPTCSPQSLISPIQTATSSCSMLPAASDEPLPSFSLTREDVQAAFEFFDVNQTGVLNMSSLKMRLSAFYPNLTSKEYRFLLEDQVTMSATISPTAVITPNGNNRMTADQLWELIETFQRLYMGACTGNNDFDSSMSTPLNEPSTPSQAMTTMMASTQAFDPVQEAFRVYDPQGTNAVDVEVLSHIMARIGFGELSSAELALLVQTADFDGDGVICLNDFRRLVSMKGRFQKIK